MSGIYPESIKYYYYTGSEWTDISAYVMHRSGERGYYGMRTNQYTDRLAAPGKLTILLNSLGGRFDPDDSDHLTGWGINTKVKMVIRFDGVDYTKFYGNVENIKLDWAHGNYTATVTITDWMNYAYKKTLTDRSIETYKSGGELASEIITAVGQTPLATNLSAGDYEFPAAFDSVTTTTKAATELNKIVLSENGYFYNRHDKVNGETVTFEAESTRNGLRTVSKLPKLAADCGLWELEANTDLVLMEDGTSFVILDEVQDAHINGTAQAYQRTHGENILNRVTVTAYPKRVDTSEQTIYSLGTPQMLAPGETKTVNVKYQNATTKESCNAITELCSQPVATTDYLMNRNKAGTSTNITANLTVSVVFHTASADVTLTNSSAYAGYVTRLYLKGYGVYQDASIRAEASDTTSITAYGDRELNIEQQYQRDAVVGEGLAAKILATEKDPRTKLEKVTMIANTSSVHMLAFLNIDIGDMVKITESDLNLAYYYYVNGIEFSVAEGNVITFSWILDRATSADDMSAIEIDFPEYESSNYSIASVNFGSFPKTKNLSEMTTILNVFFDGGYYIIQSYVYESGVVLSGFDCWYNHSSGMIYFDLITEGIWRTWYSGIASVPNNAWNRIAFRYSGDTGSFYLNGESISHTLLVTTETTAIFTDDIGNDLVFGRKANGRTSGFYGRIRQALIYNRYLLDPEIVTDNVSPGSITQGLVFAAPYVKTSDLSGYDNLTLTSESKIYELLSGRVGTPINSPVSQLIA